MHLQTYIEQVESAAKKCGCTLPELFRAAGVHRSILYRSKRGQGLQQKNARRLMIAAREIAAKRGETSDD